MVTDFAACRIRLNSCPELQTFSDASQAFVGVMQEKESITLLQFDRYRNLLPSYDSDLSLPGLVAIHHDLDLVFAGFELL